MKYAHIYENKRIEAMHVYVMHRRNTKDAFAYEWNFALNTGAFPIGKMGVESHDEVHYYRIVTACDGRNFAKPGDAYREFRDTYRPSATLAEIKREWLAVGATMHVEFTRDGWNPNSPWLFVRESIDIPGFGSFEATGRRNRRSVALGV